LVASPAASSGVVGAVLQGAASDGQPVEVAICGAEPSPEDPSMVWYRIEAWNPVAQEWENPCAGTGDIPDPRALAVGGVWDASGAHQRAPGKLTFACENGAITKCATWGYKPWASRDGRSLAELHQACTRMARADYCGNGRSHTRDNTVIDLYDSAGVMTRATEATADWDPARGSFEAAWAADGASCLARTRDGRALETILQECPGRFEAGPGMDLGDGDRCAAQRPGLKREDVLLRNRSYAAPRAAVTESGRK
ncbi:MAG TPA: ADYC domain-containing protein, partial [Myxococcaceae bacterium]|nr:ADYC domain-containing protein [Myxococcaceae bacterium]